MATLVPFVLLTSPEPDVTVNPANNANGIAEWKSAASDSQAYKCSASSRSTNNNTRKFTFKMQLPKVVTRTVGGVELPTAAWTSYVNIDVTIPVYATAVDAAQVAEAISLAFATGKPFQVAISTNSGFY